MSEIYKEFIMTIDVCKDEILHDLVGRSFLSPLEEQCIASILISNNTRHAVLSAKVKKIVNGQYKFVEMINTAIRVHVLYTALRELNKDPSVLISVEDKCDPLTLKGNYDHDYRTEKVNVIVSFRSKEDLNRFKIKSPRVYKKFTECMDA